VVPKVGETPGPKYRLRKHPPPRAAGAIEWHAAPTWDRSHGTHRASVQAGTARGEHAAAELHQGRNPTWRAVSTLNFVIRTGVT
jgi:hypothetical protein